MRHKVSELEGHLLDLAVDHARSVGPTGETDLIHESTLDWSPSTRWRDGGPIIERERIATAWTPTAWMASTWRDPVRYAGHITARGPTPLIAAMRAFSASRFGDEVELP
jgi:hypothetical protein